jgi:hypothetical protein
VYGMYPWDGKGASETDAPARSECSAGSGGRPSGMGGSRPPSPLAPVPPESELTAALQLALDRRDNGGDAKRPQ